MSVVLNVKKKFDYFFELTWFYSQGKDYWFLQVIPLLGFVKMIWKKLI